MGRLAALEWECGFGSPLLPLSWRSCLLILSGGLCWQWEGGGSEGHTKWEEQCVRGTAGAQAEAVRTRWSHRLGHLAYSRSHRAPQRAGKKLGGIDRTWDRATELSAGETNSDRVTKQGHLSRKRRLNEDT